jgi:hypothetical protein
MLNYNFSFNKSTEKALREAVTAEGVEISGIEINVDMVEADLETEVEIAAKEVVVDVLMVATAGNNAFQITSKVKTIQREDSAIKELIS